MTERDDSKAVEADSGPGHNFTNLHTNEQGIKLDSESVAFHIYMQTYMCWTVQSIWIYRTWSGHSIRCKKNSTKLQKQEIQVVTQTQQMSATAINCMLDWDECPMTPAENTSEHFHSTGNQWMLLSDTPSSCKTEICNAIVIIVQIWGYHHHQIIRSIQCCTCLYTWKRRMKPSCKALRWFS